MTGLNFAELQGYREEHMSVKIGRRCVRNLVYEWVFFAIMIGFYIPDKQKDWFIGINSLIQLALFIKGWIVIPVSLILTVLTYSRCLKTNQLEIISSLIAIPSSGWFWYVTSLYFNAENNWKTEAKYLFYIHTMLTLEALWFFFKLLFIVFVLSLVLVIIFVRNYLSCRKLRRQKENIKDKIMARDSLNITVSKIDPDEFCIICMENYKPKDKVTRLPCTQKHFYHSKCIGDWISVSPKCPLWNTDIDASMSLKSEG